MNDALLSRYAVSTFTVAGRLAFGVWVRSDAGRRGFVDCTDMADAPVGRGLWPTVGERVRGVVLGYTRTGHVRLTTRARDVALAESVANPARAMAEWVSAVNAGPADTALRDRFFASPVAEPLLRWALAHPVVSLDHRRAVELLHLAPPALAARATRGADPRPQARCVG